jgi:hypothetical protein
VGRVAGRTMAGHIIFGILTFCGLQVFYLGCFVAGCSAATGPVSFR